MLLAPGSIAAQVPGLSARALGMAGAYSVNARGFEAPSWNPAMLAIQGRPSFYLALPSVAFEFGSNTYGLGDLLRYSGKTLSAHDKTGLLNRIDSALAVRAIFGGSPVGFSVGRFALAVSAFGDADARLGKDAVELALFGNAHRSGPGAFFTAAGSRTNAWGAATIAASYAVPFRIPAGDLSIGVTAKRVFGLGLVWGAETSSRFQTDPTITAQGAGHAVYTDYAGGHNSAPGSGYGLDLGGALRLHNGITIGATVVNAIAGMSWDPGRLRYERAEYQMAQTPTGQVIDSVLRTTLNGSAIDADPAARALRDSMLAHAAFGQVLRAGATMRLHRWLLAAEASARLRDGLDRQPRQSLALAAEYSGGPILPRAGIANDFGDGISLSAGVGINLGVVRFDIGITDLKGSELPGLRVGAGLSLIFGQHPRPWELVVS